MGRASGRKRRRREGLEEAQGELPLSSKPPPPARLPCGCWDRPELFSKTCPIHQAQAEALSDAREDREARLAAKDYPPALGLLEVAVPMWVEQFRPMTWEERMKVRDRCLGIIGCTEDAESIALFVCGAAGKKPGQVAAAFNAVAQALALGALQPGGVTFAGMHFEAGDAR